MTESKIIHSELVRAALAPILQFLEDPRVTVFDHSNERLSMRLAGATGWLVTREDALSNVDARQLITNLKQCLGLRLDDPVATGILPAPWFHRFVTWLPPVTPEPTFVFNAPFREVQPLDFYIADEAITARQAEVLRESALSGDCILVVGPPLSGKTTVLNLILKMLGDSGKTDRVVTVSERKELRPTSPNSLRLYAVPGVATIEDVVNHLRDQRVDHLIIDDVDAAKLVSKEDIWTRHDGTVLGIHSTGASIRMVLDEAEAAARTARGEPATKAMLLASAFKLIVHTHCRTRSKVGFQIARMVQLTGWDAANGWQLTPLDG